MSECWYCEEEAVRKHEDGRPCCKDHNGEICEECGEFATYYSDNEPCLVNSACYLCDKCCDQAVIEGTLIDGEDGYETCESESEEV